MKRKVLPSGSMRSFTQRFVSILKVMKAAEGSITEEQRESDFSDDFDGESEESENSDEDEDLYEGEDKDGSEDMVMSMVM